MILNPQHLKIFGENISIGDYATLICSSDKKIDISTWQTDKLNGSISLGNYILISPGTSIRSAESIDIGDSTMIASDVVITDSDWHGIYDRTDYVATPKPVKIHKNVWIGERSIILKGTQIGENSIIGAGSVVHGDIPPNSVYAGNPAKEVKKLDEGSFVTREELFNDSSTYLHDLNIIEENMLEKNSFYGWIKSMFWPKK
ncbi:MAG: acyltransferase [SAR86 cluster bacterium]|jgi:acetyltransferase-like isoleucine patch superfamily enzyme|nr:acyltransferase [SAR86 cluster bacterium]MBL6810825.1 acyltransferase [SAR86 cluster bacterium]